ncbi:hypothetical protein [Cellulomonas gilvus]|uniref:Uncharacterized protein n=1 Tax=Cellulomonas gilvus (strain ATCC 13127 / NRRL B-14078) TaxID=593907 RepID=F8A307_CELGA|nr:hypothetical protein [Cellulomonas gilvus]AEI11862.1 hypothetical protein Celgi_1343 [Cellulomonas gilvus ATCC 13127]
MVTSDRARLIEQQLASTPIEVTWSTPGDLARQSMEAVADEPAPGRQMISLGTLHMAGDGVTGSAARMSAIGEVMTTFQRLVTAVGAAQEGFTALRGTFPAALLAKTQLRLIASPRLGSVVLDFMPEVPPADELYGRVGVPLIDEPRTQRADEAVVEVINMLQAAQDLSADVDESPLVEDLVGRGPRVAAALREFAKTLATSDFETDLSWRQPGEPTRRTTLPAQDAARLFSLIASRELDHGEAVIEGVIHTVSDKTALAIETDDGAWEYVRGSRLPPDALAGIRWGSRVRVIADTVEVRKPGGEVTVRYTAKGIEQLPD